MIFGPQENHACCFWFYKFTQKLCHSVVLMLGGQVTYIWIKLQTVTHFVGGNEEFEFSLAHYMASWLVLTVYATSILLIELIIISDSVQRTYFFTIGFSAKHVYIQHHLRCSHLWLRVYIITYVNMPMNGFINSA